MILAAEAERRLNAWYMASPSHKTGAGFGKKPVEQNVRFWQVLAGAPGRSEELGRIRSSGPR